MLAMVFLLSLHFLHIFIIFFHCFFSSYLYYIPLRGRYQNLQSLVFPRIPLKSLNKTKLVLLLQAFALTRLPPLPRR